MTVAGLWVSDIYTVEVNRSRPLIYPSWVEGELHQEYEIRRPSKYDLRRDVETWRHHGQTWATGGETGYKIHQDILERKEMPFQLG